jgi:excisionase family DNA binding protein
MPLGARRDTRSAARSTPRCLAGIADAAAYADVSTRTIRRYIADGRLTGYRVGPRLVKVDLADLDNLARPIPTAGGAA